MGSLRQCPCNAFQIDHFGDHLQTCQAKSAGTQVHDWAVYRLGVILGSVGHRVKIHKITSVTGKERGDVEIRDDVVLQKPRELTDCFPPPRKLILDFTLTHNRFGRSQLSSLGQLTDTRRTDGVPEPDGALRTVTGEKNRHYRQLYINRPDPIVFMPVVPVSMTILVSYCFCTRTVKFQLCLMRYQRTRSNLDFFASLVMLILRGQWG
jgi:hypothetical protein